MTLRTVDLLAGLAYLLLSWETQSQVSSRSFSQL